MDLEKELRGDSGDESEVIPVPIEEDEENMEEEDSEEEYERKESDHISPKRNNLREAPPTPPSPYKSPKLRNHSHNSHESDSPKMGHSDYKHQFGHPLPGLVNGGGYSPQTQRPNHGEYSPPNQRPNSEEEEEEEDEEEEMEGKEDEGETRHILQPTPFLNYIPPTPTHDPHSPENERYDPEVEQVEEDAQEEELHSGHPGGDSGSPQTLESPPPPGGVDGASSTRKLSTVDSLATTGTVYRKMDEVPVRTTLMGSLSILYAIFLASLGVVFPLSFFLSGRTREAGICFAILHVYVTLASIVFIIYINVAIWRDKKKERAQQEALAKDEEDELEGVVNAGDDSKLPVVGENGYMACRDRSPSPAPRSRGQNGPMRDGMSQDGSRMRTLERSIGGPGGGGHLAKVTQSDEGVNWFIKLGLIVFGMGSMVLDGFRLVQFTEIDTSMQCIGLLFLIFTALRLLFTFAQTFFLFKNHRVIINVNKLFIRFCLLHLVATNLCTWAMTIIMEGSNTYVHHQYDNLAQAEVEAEALAEGTNLTSTGAPYPAKSVNWLLEDMPPLDCYLKRTLATDASPYLFPMVIEYSLLAVAILCRIYYNVGHNVINRDDIIEAKEGTEDKAKGTLECHKANSGLFIGLFLFTIVCIAMFFFLLFEPGVNPITRTITGLVYYGTDITVNVLSLIALAPAFAQMRKLHFVAFGSERFNETLTGLSIAGFYILLGMMTIPALMSIYDGGMKALLSELQAISTILSIIQASVQVVFMFDGLRRRSATKTHFRSKPGRSLVTFILICNVSMWVINTFELKEAMTAPLFTDFYGDFAWIFIVHVGLPLAIFFRFHSTVCLSDIWVNAYRMPLLVSTRAMSPDKKSDYF